MIFFPIFMLLQVGWSAGHVSPLHFEHGRPSKKDFISEFTCGTYAEVNNQQQMCLSSSCKVLSRNIFMVSKAVMANYCEDTDFGNGCSK